MQRTEKKKFCITSPNCKGIGQAPQLILALLELREEMECTYIRGTRVPVHIGRLIDQLVAPSQNLVLDVEILNLSPKRRSGAPASAAGVFPNNKDMGVFSPLPPGSGGKG